MLRKIDELLNSITMYRLILYYLIGLLLFCFLISFFNVFGFGPVEIIVSTLTLFITCFVSNHVFAKIFNVQTNLESLYITCLILDLIITPSFKPNDVFYIALIGFMAMASKYLLAIKHKHIFNPAAISIVLSGILFERYASWWSSTLITFPVLFFGFLIIRKIRRFSLVFSFLGVSLAFLFARFLIDGSGDVIDFFKGALFSSPLLFFAFVMLSEPLTTPPTRKLQIIYGSIIGFLFGTQINYVIVYPSLELSLVAGNIFSFLVSPKERLILFLEQKLKLTNDIYDFVFKIDDKFNFKAGQYLEWTLGSKHPDSRGTRRYFTISSSPTEKNIRIGIKLPETLVSSFKTRMMEMKKGDKIIASQLAGDFVLSKYTNEKLVFIAGGIGITPFRSMIKYLIDKNEKRDIVLMYADKNLNEFIYKDVFSKAIDNGILKVIYYETDKKGHMTTDLIKEKIKDYKDRTYYLSGPHRMVTAFEDGIRELGINKKRVKVDYFPGY